MNPRWRMLLWEQWRTAGMICLTFCGISLLHGIMMHYMIHAHRLAPQDAAGQMKFLLLTYPTIAAFLLTARQNGSGQVSFDLEPRLLRLPMPAYKIFIVTIGARITGILTLILLNSILMFSLPQTTATPQWSYVAMPLYYFLLFQAIVWSYKRIPVVTDSLVLLGFIALVLHRYFTDTAPLALLEQLAAHPLVLIFLPPLSIALMAYGIYLERRDEHFGPPNSNELSQRLNHSFSLSVDKVRTPMEAQLWYENRRIGRIMPVVTFLGTIAVLLGVVTAADTSLIQKGYGQYIPLIVLPIAAMLSGIRSITMRSRYAHLRPMSDGAFTTIQMLAQLRALFFSAIIAGILSFLLFMAGTEHKQQMLNFQVIGLIDSFDIFMTILKPLILSTMTAWFFLSPFGVVAVCIYWSSNYLLFAMIAISMHHDQGTGDISQYYLMTYVGIAVILIFTAGDLLFLWIKRKISSPSLILLISIGLLLALFIYYGTEQAKGTSGILASLVWAALMIVTISNNTWFLSKRRHNAVK